MAKIAPTSLVFGVWDSRDTQAKLPRLVASTIRAFDVKRLRRSAQFNPATEYINDKLLEETTDKATKDAYAERGFVHVPATGSHGGVIATMAASAAMPRSASRLCGCSRRVRKKKTLALRRYVLGLSLVAFTANASTYLRQGCNLVPDVDKPREFTLIHSDGSREAIKLTHADALKFALAAATAFGVGPDRQVEFDKDLAKKDIAGEGETKATRKASTRRATEGCGNARPFPFHQQEINNVHRSSASRFASSTPCPRSTAGVMAVNPSGHRPPCGFSRPWLRRRPHVGERTHFADYAQPALKWIEARTPVVVAPGIQDNRTPIPDVCPQ